MGKYEEGRGRDRNTFFYPIEITDWTQRSGTSRLAQMPIDLPPLQGVKVLLYCEKGFWVGLFDLVDQGLWQKEVLSLGFKVNTWRKQKGPFPWAVIVAMEVEDVGNEILLRTNVLARQFKVQDGQ